VIIFIFAESKFIMANQSQWQEDYWLPLLQLYLRKPVGIKPAYSRPMVLLALELNIPPKQLSEQMVTLDKRESASLQQLWKRFATHQKQLSHEVQTMREMRGFNHPKQFYEGVSKAETWQTDFRPLEVDSTLTPLHLIIILDLYFRLTPITMVSDTPEIKELASLLSLKPEKVAEVMCVFQLCDPYLNRMAFEVSNLFAACHDVWQRYGNLEPNVLAREAALMKEYFKTAWHKN